MTCWLWWKLTHWNARMPRDISMEERSMTLKEWEAKYCSGLRGKIVRQLEINNCKIKDMDNVIMRVIEDTFIGRIK